MTLTAADILAQLERARDHATAELDMHRRMADVLAIQRDTLARWAEAVRQQINDAQKEERE